MKRRVIRILVSNLQGRESKLRERFLDPISGIMGWTPQALDFAGAYMALLHSELEASLEEMTRHTMTNARNQSERWAPHPVLVNCVSFFQSEVSIRLSGVELCPSRMVLEADRAVLVDAWDRLGVRQYFENRIKANHGVGLQYFERLLHPLGVVISPKTFKRVEGRGIREIARLGGGKQTELTEFVVFRGSAVHAGTSNFADNIRNENPASLRGRGLASVDLISSLGKLLARHAW